MRFLTVACGRHLLKGQILTPVGGRRGGVQPSLALGTRLGAGLSGTQGPRLPGLQELAGSVGVPSPAGCGGAAAGARGEAEEIARGGCPRPWSSAGFCAAGSLRPSGLCFPAFPCAEGAWREAGEGGSAGQRRSRLGGSRWEGGGVGVAGTGFTSALVSTLIKPCMGSLWLCLYTL